MGEDAATFLPFDDIEWAVESAEATPAELLDAARRSGARRKRMAVGQNGYFMNHSIMPAGFTVPIHAHDHSELLVVLETVPWNSDPVHKDNPDGAVRAHAFGRGGLVTYLILEDQRRVDALTVQWVG